MSLFCLSSNPTEDPFTLVHRFRRAKFGEAILGLFSESRPIKLAEVKVGAVIFLVSMASHLKTIVIATWSEPRACSVDQFEFNVKSTVFRFIGTVVIVFKDIHEGVHATVDPAPSLLH